ncbi:hypothetical protein LTR09_007169 [Extremus antarcticus]|uniref:Uncharacterized protein n=1 Tax=Extremus antarcticus TaxID=702011 RepID=A0AAJ0DD32_9PEZI|nr:hypothetical protein LTR09_007169 [Extremus antarcticus]
MSVNMFRTRAIAQAQRTLRTRSTTINRNVRFATQDASPAAAGGGSGALAGGVAGALAASGIFYGYYHFSGARTAVQYAQQTKSYVDSATNSLKVQFEEKTPDSNQALQTLKDAAKKYAAFIPGASQYLDTAFKDLESVKQKHSDEVDKIVSEAYGELRDASKKGMNFEAATEVYSILSKHLERLFSLAGDAGEDILNNHPQLKEKLGGSTDQLKQLGEKYGPKARQQIDETWKQVQDIINTGLRPDNIEKIRNLLQDKVKEIRKMGEEAYEEGKDQAKEVKEQAKGQAEEVKEDVKKVAK